MISPDDEKAIRERLRTYLDVFEKADYEAYADQFVFPACIWANGTWIGIPDRETCLQSSQGWRQAARDLGAVRGAILDMQVIPLLSRVAVNRLRYQRLGSDQRPVEDVTANYLMIKLDDGRWKIATVAGESEPLR